MGIDPNNIVVTGSSAGAITVQQAEWEICNSTPMAAGLPEGFNYKGVMAFAGAVLVDGPLGYKSAPCPVMMFHGTEDELVPYDVIRQSVFLRTLSDSESVGAGWRNLPVLSFPRDQSRCRRVYAADRRKAGGFH